MGGLLLTKNNKDQNFFPNNYACIMYRNINEAKLAVNSVIKNYRKYKLIKNNAYKIAKKHSYKERAKYILKLYMVDKIQNALGYLLFIIGLFLIIKNNQDLDFLSLLIINLIFTSLLFAYLPILNQKFSNRFLY